jgi:hypothetical protein
MFSQTSEAKRWILVLCEPYPNCAGQQITRPSTPMNTHEDLNTPCKMAWNDTCKSIVCLSEELRPDGTNSKNFCGASMIYIAYQGHTTAKVVAFASL